MAACGASDPGFLDGAARSRSFVEALAGLSHGKFPDLIREPSVPLCNDCNTVTEMVVVPSICYDLLDAAGVVQRDVVLGDDGPDILVTWPLSEGDDPLSKSIADPLFSVPITIVSREQLQYHLSRDSVVLHAERILDNNSDDDGSLFGEGLDSQENYDLNIIQIDDEGFSKKSGKHKKRNSIKK
ncbi:hypothetical protein MA16_Dca011765 [Dendrobium catenatum]|uniref:Uncharacterized protein n=1 Tax=Dendrobium catenatum TaxID=906689 RepID=A0A2I0WEH7_9ASPA|nr:hypothetical protein MA16_Dca011765 [Dendrobium catenatum]